jgi:CRP/FNR family cyclic AMP-dependent transcriptional regulator
MPSFFDYPTQRARATAPGEAGPPDTTAAHDHSVRSGLLATFTSKDWVDLRRHATVEAVRSGASLLRQGEVDRSLFIVLTGALVAQVSGHRTPIVPGEMVGEVAFFDGRPRSVSVIAQDDTEVLHLSLDPPTAWVG